MAKLKDKLKDKELSYYFLIISDFEFKTSYILSNAW